MISHTGIPTKKVTLFCSCNIGYDTSNQINEFVNTLHIK